MSTIPSDSPRRLLLRVTVKLMALFAGLAVAAVLFSPLLDDPAQQSDSPTPLRIPLSPVDSPSLSRHPWAGGNLILLQVPATSPLNYPAATQLQNPEPSQPQRTRRTGLFLAYDRGTDMGCPMQWVAPGSAGTPLQPWPGGFRDTCRGSWYDAAGRVLRGQEAKRNLAIPPYRLIEPDLLEVGVNGDNSAPAK